VPAGRQATNDHPGEREHHEQAEHELHRDADQAQHDQCHAGDEAFEYHLADKVFTLMSVKR
jgi:hypothetical protein